MECWVRKHDQTFQAHTLNYSQQPAFQTAKLPSAHYNQYGLNLNYPLDVTVFFFGKVLFLKHLTLWIVLPPSRFCYGIIGTACACLCIYRQEQRSAFSSLETLCLMPDGLSLHITEHLDGSTDSSAFKQLQPQRISFNPHPHALKTALLPSKSR